jgi:tetratricopeptide (TPR) repeat protein
MSAVIELQPQDTALYLNARKLIDAGDVEKADKMLSAHLLRNPDDALALSFMVEIFKKVDRVPVAYQLAKRITELRPDRAEAWCSLGGAAQALWRLDESIDCYKKAIQRAVSNNQRALYASNIASSMLDGGSFVKSEEYCRKAYEIDSEDVSIRHNLGLSLLGQRRWKEAWPFYSASIGGKQRRNVKYKDPPEPSWDGTKDQTIVVYGEQGLGDEICAASMLPDVIRDRKKVIIDCDHRLKNLFKRSFPQATVHGTRWVPGEWKDEAASVDASIAGFEVGKFYRNSDADFPGAPYLVPCPDRLAMWKSMWATKKKPVIGIAWNGGIWQNAAMYRELPLSEWKPIFNAIDAHWVSLQYKDAEKEIVGTPVMQYSGATLTPNYDDTAALVASCDLVIGMQTSVCHAAGALGVPVWTLIPKTSQWRYGEEYTDVPWYKGMKLYRQKGSWAPVVKQIVEDLKAWR